MPTTFFLTNRREVEDSARYDLRVDGQLVLQHVTFMKAFTYVLDHIGLTDMYQYQESNDGSDDDDRKLSGKQVLQTHTERRDELANRPHEFCTRCGEATKWIGYCDIHPYGPYSLQHTFFMQCGTCGLYRQVGFENQDDWKGETYRHLMQERIPFVRTARDPFQHNGTLRGTSRSAQNPMGRMNLDGHEFYTGEPISVYDQEAEAWRDGRIEFAYGYADDVFEQEQLRKQGYWYFIGNDDEPDLSLKQGMKARFRR